MRPLPDSGVVQRESGTFLLFPLSLSVNLSFHLKHY
nr:MAG TPA: hypothetical protein [Caudoviricetes sp.]